MSQMKAFIDRLLKLICEPSLLEAITGDLEELYELDMDKNPAKADRKYLLNAVAFIRYHRLRKRHFSKTQNNMSLIKNYAKISFRDLLRHRTYTAVNMLGLVSGLAVSLFILQYVLYEVNFDKFHADFDRIHRVINDRYQNGELVQHGTITYPTIGPTMTNDFPEVESYTRMTISGRMYVQNGDNLFISDHGLYADEYFLNFFSFKTLYGDATTALDAPNKLVITESYAKRILPPNKPVTDLLGSTLIVDGDPCQVTAIVEDVPPQSHLQFELLVSYKTFIEWDAGSDNSWTWSDFYHYVKVKEGTDVAAMRPKLEQFGITYFKNGEVSGGTERFWLQPLEATHFDNSMEYEIGETIDGEVVWLMLGIALFILAVAWINYINLTSSRSLQRAKEVSIKRSIGAGQANIIGQFVVETLLFNGLALGLSFVVLTILQPFFNNLTGIELGMEVLLSDFFGAPFPALFAIFFLVSCVIISIYPAWLVSKFQAKDVMHGRYQLKGESAWLRKGLVVFQFATAVVLINAAMAVSDQIDYMMNKDLGIDIDNTMVLYGPSLSSWDSTFISRADRFKNSLATIPGISSASTSSRVAGSGMGRVFHVRSLADPEAKNLTVNFFNADHNYIEVFGLKVLAGRDFESKDHHPDPSQIRNIVINEAAVSLLGINNTEEAIGASVEFWNKKWTIIGVVNDFHQLSLHDQIEPLFLLPYYNTGNAISLKLDGPLQESTLAKIEEEYQAAYPGNYFDYYFLEDRYQRQYAADLRLGRISQIFTVLSLIMVVLGLYGLLTMTLNKKVKEIGIRKVLGARLEQILMVLAREFAWLMLVAMVIGIPVSIYGIQEWKAGFAYTKETQIALIAFSSLLVVLISVMPVIFQSGKVMKNNPVDSLRAE